MRMVSRKSDRKGCCCGSARRKNSSRLKKHTRQRVTGNVLTMDETTMTIIDHDGQHVTIPRERITRLDVNVGRKRNALRGLLVGAAFGSALFAAALATGDSSHGSDSYFPTALLFPVVATPRRYR